MLHALLIKGMADDYLLHYKIETIYLTTRLNHGYCQYINLQSTNEGFTIFTETYNKISTYKNFKTNQYN